MTEELHSLGWTLLHSIWQSACVAGGLFVLLRIGSAAFTSQTKYALGMTALACLVVWNLHTFWAATTVETQTVNEFVMQVKAASPESVVSKTPLHLVDQAIPWVLIVWVSGVAISLLQLVHGLIGVRNLRSSAVYIQDYNDTLEKVRAHVGVRSVVRLAESIKVQGPVVIGHLRPLILVPVGFFTGLPQDQVRMVLAHEMAHIVRNDYLIHVFQRIIVSIYFFNPFVRWISRTIDVQREFACDDLAMQTGDHMALARALSFIAHKKHRQTVLMALEGGSLTSRIERIVKRRKMDNNNRPVLVALFLLLSGAFVWQQQHQWNKQTTIENFREAGLFHEPVRVPVVGPNLSINLGLDTIPEPSFNYNFNWDQQVDADAILESLDIPSLVINLQDLDLPETIELPPLPEFHFDMDTVIPEATLRELQQSLERMESEQLRAFERFFFEHEEMMLRHEKMARELEKHVRQQMEDMEFQEWDEAYAKRMEEMTRELDKSLKEQLEKMEEQLEKMPDYEAEMKRYEELWREEVRHVEQFESDMKKQLKKDGYWESGELRIRFNDNSVEINGERIKDKDAKKYLEIRRKYFPNDPDFDFGNH